MAEEKASEKRHGIWPGFAGARLAIVKRVKAIVLLPMVAAFVTFVVVSFIPDRYMATVLIQIDPRQKPAALSDGAAASLPPAFEAERLAVNDQINILESSSLIGDVVASLNLASDPEFQARPLFARITKPFERLDAETVAREALTAALTIQRVRNSSLISVRFLSRDAAKAATIANAVAAQYIAQERSGTSDVSKTGSGAPTASEKAFDSLLNQYGLTRTLSGARVVEKAQIPQRPATPKRGRIVTVVAVSTLIFMLAMAILLERDALLRTQKVEQMLACPHVTSLPTLIPDDDEETPARGARLIIAEPKCRYADAVRAACEALSERDEGEGARVILVASALPGEGAEHFASNIAHHLAVAGQKSLLVDCDFHSKSLTRQLAPRSASGLLDQVAAREPIENVILRDSLTGVHFLPASGPAPIPLPAPTALRSVEFIAAFRHLKARFGTIVLSAPPLLDAPDGLALAELADQIVFLTAWHRTPRTLARKALSQLEANQSKVVGAVLADITDDRDIGFMSFAAMFDEIRRAARMSPVLDRAA